MGEQAYGVMTCTMLGGEANRRARVCKLHSNPILAELVTERLHNRWSPQQIAASLKKEFPDSPGARVSHETIYQSLYVQGRGSLRKELNRYLRSQQTRRKPRTQQVTRHHLRDMVMISERPAIAQDRAVPGHWEGDLIIGKGSRSAIGTLVERRSRYVMLMHLPQGRCAEQVCAALIAQIQKLPAHLIKTLTWDQGGEMAEHARFSVATGVKVFFCNPHSPWERGSNENTNGLLRQYFPKGTDLSVHDQITLDAVAAEMNGRPRQTLKWMKPSEVFAMTVASLRPP